MREALFQQEVTAVLEPYQSLVEAQIKENLPLLLGEKTPLRDACEYSLLNGGKRFRPALCHMIANALGKGWNPSFAALGIEFSHTASLIADDLPCMDNDDERRGRPSTHKLYGEPLALLASYALLSSGYACIQHNVSALGEKEDFYHRGMLALQNAAYNGGVFGATGGQYLDLFPQEVSLALVQEVIRKKTTSLFEISFVYGWLFGGGELSQLALVKKAAQHFGNAFQIADDLFDAHQDALKARKINLVLASSKEKALEILHQELKQFYLAWAELEVKSEELIRLAKTLLCVDSDA